MTGRSLLAGTTDADSQTQTSRARCGNRRTRQCRLRVPAHPVALALLTESGGGIAAPSANRYGRVSATTAEHVHEEFGATVDYILDGGACRVGIESTIVSCLGDVPVLLRPGVITPSALSEVLGRPVLTPDGQQVVPRRPGSDAAHYAPTLPARV